MLRKFVRLHKNDDLVDEVELINANPSYTNIRYSDGKETSVSIIYPHVHENHVGMKLIFLQILKTMTNHHPYRNNL